MPIILFNASKNPIFWLLLLCPIYKSKDLDTKMVKQSFELRLCPTPMLLTMISC